MFYFPSLLYIYSWVEIGNFELSRIEKLTEIEKNKKKKKLANTARILTPNLSQLSRIQKLRNYGEIDIETIQRTQTPSPHTIQGKRQKMIPP